MITEPYLIDLKTASIMQTICPLSSSINLFVHILPLLLVHDTNPSDVPNL